MRAEQTDVSIKNLLKQVYAAHSTKVKSLEDEVEELKNKLLEAERKLKQQETDCKRCAELEEAFTTCKAALQEQTKWFENFGQKFSVFNSSENKASSTRTSKLQDDTVQVHNEISCLQQSSPVKEKSSVSKQVFLKNLMSLNPEEFQDSLDLCTAPFPAALGQDCSSLNPDSLILAPDTVDISADVQQIAHKPTKTKHEVSRPSEKLCRVVDKVKDAPDTNRFGKKRTYIDSVGSRKSPNKKLNKGTENDSSDSSDEKKVTGKDVTNKDVQLLIKEKSIKSVTLLKTNLSESQSQIADNANSKSNKDTDTVNNTKKGSSNEITKDADTVSSKEIPCIEVEKNYQTKPEEIISKDSMYQVSPSLLPVNKKNDKCILQNPPTMAEDINDFQMPTVNKKQMESEQAWTSCDKKKLKKGLGVKTIKSTSKFKMSLDSLPPNYKKPSFRQTKLSKSIFQPKPSTSNGIKKVLGDCNNDPALWAKNGSPVKSVGKTGTIDFDATCIPENYGYEVVALGENIASGGSDHDLEESIMLIESESSNESFTHRPDGSPMQTIKCNPNEEIAKENEEKAHFEDFLSNKKQVSNENLNSFDRLPKKEEPNYKYKEETVRKKSERRQLNGFDCRECEKYFTELGLSDTEKKERLNKCSRHRSKFAPPPTPEHFWELDFPDTQECKARGYLNETQKVKLKTHRRRPL